MNELDTELQGLDRLLRGSFVVGAVGLIVCFVGGIFNPFSFFQSYLMAFVFWIGVPVGCFAILMIHHLVGGTWGFVIQRPLEAAVRTFPVMGLLFIPLFCGMSYLFVWARPAVVMNDHLLQEKAAYLNIPFFVLRYLIYFAIWIAVGYFLVKWSRQLERTDDSSFVAKIQALSGPGLVLWGLTVTFSAIDWVMSLEPRWYSTIFGLIFMMSHGVAALGLMIGVVFMLSRRKPLADVMAPWIFQDLGNLMLAFVMLWIYVSFSQFMLIWIENLSPEIPWYLHRTVGGWAVLGTFVVALQFALPFLLLLSRAIKRDPAGLCAVALLIVFMHLLEIFWFVAPAFHITGFSISWFDVIAPIGMGGIWLAAFLWLLQGVPLLPTHDPRFIAIVKERELLKHG